MRERIATIITSDGETYDVFNLRVIDILDIDLTKPSALYHLCAKSLDIPFDVFCEWSWQDATKVAEYVTKSMELLK